MKACVTPAALRHPPHLPASRQHLVVLLFQLMPYEPRGRRACVRACACVRARVQIEGQGTSAVLCVALLHLATCQRRTHQAQRAERASSLAAYRGVHVLPMQPYAMYMYRRTKGVHIHVLPMQPCTCTDDEPFIGKAAVCLVRVRAWACPCTHQGWWLCASMHTHAVTCIRPMHSPKESSDTQTALALP